MMAPSSQEGTCDDVMRMNRKNTGDTSLGSMVFVDDLDDDASDDNDNDIQDDDNFQYQPDDFDLEKALPLDDMDGYSSRTRKSSEKTSRKRTLDEASLVLFFQRILPNIVELAGCGLFYLCTSLVYKHMVELNYRPIPVDFMNTDSGTQYARNRVFDQAKPDHETVPYAWLRLAGVLCPMMQIGLGLAQGCGRRGGPWFRHVSATLCTYTVALAITQLVTNSVKKYVGYWRPHFFAVCNPNEDYTACETEHTAAARKSFPSSHTATIFTIMMLLALYIHNTFGIPSVIRQIQVTKNGKTFVVKTYIVGIWERHLARIVSLASLLPVAAAVFVGSSRIVDNYHHPADVVGGALLGSAVSLFCHGLWFGTNVDLGEAYGLNV